MTSTLDGARLKIIRAQEHLDSLKSEVRMYLDEQPKEIKAESYSHPQAYIAAAIGPMFKITTPNLGTPPLRLSTIIGDCVTNARAALDYVMYELAARYFDPSFDISNSEHRRISTYPTINDPRDVGLKDRLNRLANLKVPAPAIAHIKATQPYNAGYEPLWWLHELVNRDKHRMPLLTNGEFDNFTVSLAFSPLFPEFNPPPVTDTITIPRDHVTPSTPLLSNMDMQAKLTIFVTWKDVPVPREPVDRTLEQIIKTVADIVPRFDAFFP